VGSAFGPRKECAGLDWSVAGVEPEPRAGYKRIAERDRELEAFCSACWQRHEARAPRREVIEPWPTRETFRANWPLLSFDLIVSSWKIETAPLDRDGEVAAELLDPPVVPVLSWRERYAAELDRHPALASDLRAELLADLDGGRLGDGVERVLERGRLSTGERAVVRAWLYGDDGARIAEDLGWRPQTVALLLANGRYRLRWLGSPKAGENGRARERSVSRAGDPDAPRAPAPPAPAVAMLADLSPRAGNAPLRPTGRRGSRCDERI
jgi:hypothetical protein